VKNSCATSSQRRLHRAALLRPDQRRRAKNLIWMFMQSSTMDYAGEATQDLIGLGIYDYAAAACSTAEWSRCTPTQLQRRYAAGRGHAPQARLVRRHPRMQPEIGAGNPDDPTETRTIHYSQLQNDFEMIQNCVEVDKDLFKPARYDTARDGNWNALLDAQLVTVDRKTTRCRQQPVDYVQWQTLKSSSSRWRAGNRGLDAQGRTRLPTASAPTAGGRG